MLYRPSSVSYFRNFVFGVEDSLVSTVGLLSGVAIANVPKSTILLTGVVLLFVEAVSMTGGSFLSEYSVDEYERRNERVTKSTLISSLIMFLSYFISGFIPLFPYMILPVSEALVTSAILSVVFLFILGVIGAKISKTNVIRNGFRMAIIGGTAIAVGVLAGTWLSGIK